MMDKKEKTEHNSIRLDTAMAGLLAYGLFSEAMLYLIGSAVSPETTIEVMQWSYRGSLIGAPAMYLALSKTMDYFENRKKKSKPDYETNNSIEDKLK